METYGQWGMCKAQLFYWPFAHNVVQRETAPAIGSATKATWCLQNIVIYCAYCKKQTATPRFECCLRILLFFIFFVRIFYSLSLVASKKSLVRKLPLRVCAQNVIERLSRKYIQSQGFSVSKIVESVRVRKVYA